MVLLAFLLNIFYASGVEARTPQPPSLACLHLFVPLLPLLLMLDALRKFLNTAQHDQTQHNMTN